MAVWWVSRAVMACPEGQRSPAAALTDQVGGGYSRSKGRGDRDAPKKRPVGAYAPAGGASRTLLLVVHRSPAPEYSGQRDLRVWGFVLFGPRLRPGYT